MSIYHKKGTPFLNILTEEDLHYISFLPTMEQDIFNFYVVKRFRQKEIAKMFKMTQGAVSSKLRRINQRITFLKQLKEFDVRNLEKDLSPVFEALSIEILKGILETTCQTSAAQKVNELFNLEGKNKLNQVKVRYRFKKMVDKLKQIKSPYYELYSLIDKNIYMLHEVRLPHFDKRRT